MLRECPSNRNQVLSGIEIRYEYKQVALSELLEWLVEVSEMLHHAEESCSDHLDREHEPVRIVVLQRRMQRRLTRNSSPCGKARSSLMSARMTLGIVYV